MEASKIRASSEAEEQFAIAAECLCDLETLAKCNAAAVTDDAKCATIKTFHVLSERLSTALQNIERALKR